MSKKEIIGFCIAFSPIFAFLGVAYWFGGTVAALAVIVGALIGIGSARISAIGVDMITKDRE